VTSGPLSFIELFDHTTAVISAGGRRRGANMAVLRVDHPDIEELIDAKRGGERLTNFNLSVGTTAEFWTAQERGDRFPLRNPRSGAVVRSVDPNRLLDRIAAAAWECGDPGLLFFDRIERDNPTPELGSIEATNPCGEQPLLPNESCTLGSLNLAAFALDDDLDWPRFREAVHDAVRFLDNVIEANRYPFPDIETTTRRTRKIGLGVMGLADLLARLRMPYDSPAARALGSRIAQTLTGEARAASVALGRQRGSFPALTRSRWPQRGFDCLRNAAVTCVAPTGSVSYLAGVSSGIEPFFALATARRFADGRMVEELVPCFREALKCLPDGGDALLATIQARGSFAGLEGVPDEWRRRFQTALEIAPADHLAMQAVFQEHVDAAVSKTVNLAADTTCEVVREIFLLARRLDLKGVTVYRYGSRPRQTLSLAGEPECRECAF
jgi:ribonucleoside-diphosphate reductase alpha chain